ncbi:ATP19 (YOL077W-A) [Zygosaccharomyces parabailii]|uniref:BN860_10374g1_1 n=1 Tax=Zygosaccharomyces bailii (strain CLIB 213 / ATCC 58445 / CBS 680 / BCRC 21525 / NBRC 1098 / NCYC 1416 / NRRL Y-2227) TaxID=1333698 RepID=A0A8J2SZ34_ZYGB2|nr:ATP19 (YOL077W-A) [Zygosaccharomyces parabailii]CDF87611.1 BN860_10374g1_1 [Zygosaccharomyces bailii CLIB 213]SJM87819.1 uncharacterized protein ZBIST_4008 [Zygosaccharomyces bailii]
MGHAYQILGRTCQPHQIAIATLGFVALLAAPNPFSKKQPKTVDFSASSPEEEKFIKEYVQKHSKAEH